MISPPPPRSPAGHLRFSVWVKASSIRGHPDTEATLLHLVALRASTLPAGLTGTQGYTGTAPTAQADLEIQKNGVSIGTVTFAASGNTATFTLPSRARSSSPPATASP